MWPIHTTGYDLVMKMNEVLIHATTQMNSEALKILR